MAYDPDNVFARILRGEIPSTRVHEDDEFIAIRDVSPQAPTHILVIPRGAGPEGPPDPPRAKEFALPGVRPGTLSTNLRSTGEFA